MFRTVLVPLMFAWKSDNTNSVGVRITRFENENAGTAEHQHDKFGDTLGR